MVWKKKNKFTNKKQIMSNWNKTKNKNAKNRGKATKSSVKAIVKREIAKNVENKTFQLQATRDIWNCTSSAFSSQVFPIAPQSNANNGMEITQGVGQGQRVGNTLNIKKLMFRYYIAPNGYNASSNPQPRPMYIILWVYYDKASPTVIQPLIGSSILQQGNTTVGLTNTPQDFLNPVNSDRWRVLMRKVHKIGYAQSSGTGDLPQYQSFTNNDFKMAYRGTINMTKWVNKKIKYSDTNNIPNNRTLLYCFQAVSAISPFNSTELPAFAFVNLDMEYEDA